MTVKWQSEKPKRTGGALLCRWEPSQAEPGTSHSPSPFPMHVLVLLARGSSALQGSSWTLTEGLLNCISLEPYTRSLSVVHTLSHEPIETQQLPARCSRSSPLDLSTRYSSWQAISKRYHPTALSFHMSIRQPHSRRLLQSRRHPLRTLHRSPSVYFARVG